MREIRELDGRDNITVTGTVDDVGAYIRAAQVCVNPVLAAGGMQNKLIEYLASGVPTVATAVANEGIGAPDGEALLVRDTSDAFVAGILEILGSPETGTRLARAGRRFVEEHWTWEAHFLKLERDFHDALGHPGEKAAEEAAGEGAGSGRSPGPGLAHRAEPDPDLTP